MPGPGQNANATWSDHPCDVKTFRKLYLAHLDSEFDVLYMALDLLDEWENQNYVLRTWLGRSKRGTRQSKHALILGVNIAFPKLESLASHCSEVGTYNPSESRFCTQQVRLVVNHSCRSMMTRAERHVSWGTRRRVPATSSRNRKRHRDSARTGRKKEFFHRKLTRLRLKPQESKGQQRSMETATEVAASKVAAGSSGGGVPAPAPAGEYWSEALKSFLDHIPISSVPGALQPTASPGTPHTLSR
jgi:hypothetical protein